MFRNIYVRLKERARFWGGREESLYNDPRFQNELKNKNVDYYYLDAFHDSKTIMASNNSTNVN